MFKDLFCLPFNVVLAGLLTFVVSTAFGQVESSNIANQSISAELLFPVAEPGKALLQKWPTVSVDLGAVPVGSQNDVEIAVVNSSAFDVSFRKIISGCACSNVQFERNAFPANSTTKGKLRYKAPKSSLNGDVYVGLWFYGAEDEAESAPVAAMRLKLFLSDNIAVDKGSTTYEMADEGLSTFTIPVFVTEPIRATNLKVSKSADFRDVEVRLDLVDGKPLLVIQAAALVIGAEGVQGNVFLEDSVSGKKLAVDLALTSRPKISIHPNYLQFRPIPDEPGVSKALVLIRVCQKDKAGEVPKIQLLGCSCAGNPVEMKSTEIGGGIHKVEIKVVDRDIKQAGSPNPSAPQLSWQVDLVDSEGEKETVTLTTGFGGIVK